MLTVLGAYSEIKGTIGKIKLLSMVYYVTFREDIFIECKAVISYG